MSQKQLNATGSKGRIDVGKYDPTTDLVTVMDPEHLLFHRVSTWRYDPENPTYKERMASIDEVGVQTPGAIRLRSRPDGSTFNEVIWGNRRTLKLREKNRRLVEGGAEPELIGMMIRNVSDELMLLLYAIENEDREENDWLTRVQAMNLMLNSNAASGVPIERVAARFHLPVNFVRRLTDPEKGVLAATDSVQVALVRGRLMIDEALAIARLPREKQDEVVAERLARDQKKTTRQLVRAAADKPVVPRLTKEHKKEIGRMSQRLVEALRTGDSTDLLPTEPDAIVAQLEMWKQIAAILDGTVAKDGPDDNANGVENDATEDGRSDAGRDAADGEGPAGAGPGCELPGAGAAGG